MLNANNKNYIDHIMTNHMLESSSDDIINIQFQKGGAKLQVPNGGFPPMYIITNKTEETNKVSKNRQLGTLKSVISIKDLLKTKIT